MSSQNQYFLNTNPTYPASTMSTGLDAGKPNGPRTGRRMTGTGLRSLPEPLGGRGSLLLHGEVVHTIRHARQTIVPDPPRVPVTGWSWDQTGLADLTRASVETTRPRWRD